MGLDLPEERAAELAKTAGVDRRYAAGCHAMK